MSQSRLAPTPRNDPLGLAQRAWTNLRLVEREYDAKEKGHVVTQLVQSLLTLIVFPKEGIFFEHIESCTLDKLEARGWLATPAEVG